MAEERGWSAWRKESKKTIDVILLCVCVVTQVVCFLILSKIFKAQRDQTDEVPQKIAEGKSSTDEEAGDTVQSPKAHSANVESPVTAPVTIVNVDDLVDKQVAESSAEAPLSEEEVAAQIDLLESARIEVLENEAPAGNSSSPKIAAGEAIVLEFVDKQVASGTSATEAVQEVADGEATRCWACCNGSSKVGVSSQQAQMLRAEALA
jgi:hypothetical protein